MQESNSGKMLYKRLIVRFILVIIYIVLLTFVFPRIFRILLPFIVALIVGAILNPLVSKINEKVSKHNKNFLITRKITTLVLNLLILLAVSFFIYYLAYTIVKEVIAFSLNIQQNWQSIVVKFDVFQERFIWLIDILPPKIIDILEGFKTSILTFVRNISRSLLTFTVSITASMITRTGTFFINFLTFFLALYFFISDYSLIKDLAKKYTNKRFVEPFIILKTSVVNAFCGYFKAQFILALFAFIFMFASLAIYGQQYAFVISLFLGLIDLLPIIGVIAVLVPWGIIEFVAGDINKGIFLIFIGIVFFLIRKVVEPKVMGSQTGLHPLLALMSTYVGLQLLGVWGAVLGPVILMLIISMGKSGMFTNTISDIKLLYNKVSILLRNQESLEPLDSEKQ